MANGDDVVLPSQVWAAFPSTTDENRSSVYEQLLKALATLPMPSVQTILDKAPESIKEIVWWNWARKADLSGVMLSDVIGLQETEPIRAIYSIILEWLNKVDLSKYDLRQISKASSLLRGLEDKQHLWVRWLDTSSELRAINLVEFCIAISDFSPELQLTIITRFAARCPNIDMYSTEERQKAGKHIAGWARAQCTIFGTPVTGKTAPLYNVDDLVVVNHDGKEVVRRVESRIYNQGWHYSLRDEFKYRAETLIMRTV